MRFDQGSDPLLAADSFLVRNFSITVYDSVLVFLEPPEAGVLHLSQSSLRSVEVDWRPYAWGNPLSFRLMMGALAGLLLGEGVAVAIDSDGEGVWTKGQWAVVGGGALAGGVAGVLMARRVRYRERCEVVR